MHSFTNVHRPTPLCTVQGAAAPLAVRPPPAVRSARNSKSCRDCAWCCEGDGEGEIITRVWSINIPCLEASAVRCRDPRRALQ
ncbi:hypothetical protein CY34DRAFT_360556 [Suillus luteus UH-Slu-Lm8-n1]|uniref:Uncharacterized protein n=1 Tax=Suillus luteus UH-Slu-Lm8-n1 TaxID=930992 RepID=A0A0D0ABA0_9AGAM|nr:hypothetical protein CY34DRAFT_360556 [Suillus luteus UH-Slu-Lm8-n1]